MLSIHVLLAHHVVLNHTFELLISMNKWNYKQMYMQVNISTHEMYIHACCNKLCVTARMIEIEPHSEEQ